ncbi:hypothetical protein HHE01_02770 [Helicobacter heilmannii]|uniref:Uncharacterized protein n=1 Tax=Helicobacter heilmannii TaxID=35817 RepID=A0A0K2YC49_HELHE|nr:hypothetical protein HHE01_02770 [Helicobacter heilmannii]
MFFFWGGGGQNFIKRKHGFIEQALFFIDTIYSLCALARKL